MSSLEYVTLEEAKCQLRVSLDDDYDDGHINLLIKAASGAIKNYMKNFAVYEAERNADNDYLLDSNGEPIIDEDSNVPQYVKPEVKLAVLMLISEWYKNREGDGAAYEDAVLPAPIRALLYPLRDPASQ